MDTIDMINIRCQQFSLVHVTLGLLHSFSVVGA